MKGQLYKDFAAIPKAHIQKMFLFCNSLYAPTHIILTEQLKSGNPPFKTKTTPTRRENKGKRHDPEFTREREWLLKYLEENSDDDGECADGIECGCCFSNYKFVRSCASLTPMRASLTLY
jgi:TRIAD3 protein (E3 ubiquitin-protein ligase RNF216)